MSSTPLPISRNIPLFKVFFHPDLVDALQETLLSGYVGQGPKVEQLEVLLRERLKYQDLLTISNATAGLELALQMIGVGPGDEVISTPLTFCATNLVILKRFAHIKWADIDPRTCNIDIDNILSLVSERTKAIVVVLLNGYPVQVDRLKATLKAAGLNIPIIQDCAQAFGSLYQGQHVGTGASEADYSVFSFQATKTFNTVDGGMILTPQIDRVKRLRYYGIDRDRGRDYLDEPGLKWYMNELNATIGIRQLASFDELLRCHRRNAIYYRKELQNVSGLELLQEDAECVSSYYGFTILAEKREDLIKMLKSAGINAARVESRNDLYSCMKSFQRDLPCLDSIYHKIVNIPVGWWVSEEDANYITTTIKRGW